MNMRSLFEIAYSSFIAKSSYAQLSFLLVYSRIARKK